MRTVFCSWKYIFKNIWFLLPFAIVPAVFMALSLDYQCISKVWGDFFTGDPRAEFLDLFHAWSFLRVDSVLGLVYSLLAIVAAIFFLSLLLAFVEKHMRLGKRTLSGIWSQFTNNLPSVIFAVIVYLVLYEAWAIVLSAVMFAAAEISATVTVYILDVIFILVFAFVLVYLSTFFYLWLPCKQMTGFGAFEAFTYSYRLVSGVRSKLIVSFFLSLAALFILLCGCSFLPAAVFYIVGFVAFALLFMNFAVRMEAVYFETDKLDREDVLRHKWEV